VRPFLLLGTRAEAAAADDEYAAFLRFSGLPESALRRVQLDREPLGEVDLDAWSGILLGGGPFNASDPVAAKSATQHRVERELAALLDAVVERDHPFLGACYGIGTLGVHQGAVVDRTYAEPVGQVTVTLTRAGLEDRLTSALPEAFDAFGGHKEAITVLPPHAVNLASSPGCPVQAFRVRSNVYATQFHPELDVDGICTRIEVYKHAGYFAPEEAESLKELARESVVIHPPQLLKRFVELYASG
jgi:GMP synthase (glutamine-hydrolysing)